MKLGGLPNRIGGQAGVPDHTDPALLEQLDDPAAEKLVIINHEYGGMVSAHRAPALRLGNVTSTSTPPCAEGRVTKCPRSTAATSAAARARIICSP